MKVKPKLIQEYLEKGITKCENCGSKFYIDFHHRPSRSSQEAVHDFDHTRLLCQECHTFFEQHDDIDEKFFNLPKRGYDLKYKIDIMQEKQKEKTKKADWQKPHQCKHCKQLVSMLICPKCGEISI